MLRKQYMAQEIVLVKIDKHDRWKSLLYATEASVVQETHIPLNNQVIQELP